MRIIPRAALAAMMGVIALESWVVMADETKLWSMKDGAVPMPRPTMLTIHGIRGELVTIHLDDGRVEFGPDYTTDDETSRQFWEALGVYWRSHYAPISR